MVTTKLLTAQDLWNLGDSPEDCELIEGELTTVAPPGAEHAHTVIKVAVTLYQLAEAPGLGFLFADAGFLLRRDPDTVLAPDVAFVVKNRLPEVQTRYLELAPDLAVEIVSPGNSPGEIERKLSIYLEAGVQSVWIVYPKERKVVIHSPHKPPRVFNSEDVITSDDVLPGLSIEVSAIFGG